MGTDEGDRVVGLLDRPGYDRGRVGKFKSDDGDWFCGFKSGEIDGENGGAGSGSVELLEREFLFRIGESGDRFDRGLEAVKLEMAVWFGEEVKEQGVAFGGDAAPRKIVNEGAGGSAVDGLAVGLEPGADLAQALGAGSGHDAIGIGADVEKVVGIFADEIDEGGDEIIGGFPLVVVFFESPSVIKGGAGFPIAFEATGREEVVARKIVVTLSVSNPTGDETGGLELLDETADASALGFAEGHRRVEPDHADGAVLGEEFAELRKDFLLEVAFGVFGFFVEVPRIPRAIGVMPIEIL